MIAVFIVIVCVHFVREIQRARESELCVKEVERRTEGEGPWARIASVRCVCEVWVGKEWSATRRRRK